MRGGSVYAGGYNSRSGGAADMDGMSTGLSSADHQPSGGWPVQPKLLPTVITCEQTHFRLLLLSCRHLLGLKQLPVVTHNAKQCCEVLELLWLLQNPSCFIGRSRLSILTTPRFCPLLFDYCADY